MGTYKETLYPQQKVLEMQKYLKNIVTFLLIQNAKFEDMMKLINFIKSEVEKKKILN